MAVLYIHDIAGKLETRLVVQMDRQLHEIHIHEELDSNWASLAALCLSDFHDFQ